MQTIDDISHPTPQNESNDTVPANIEQQPQSTYIIIYNAPNATTSAKIVDCKDMACQYDIESVGLVNKTDIKSINMGMDISSKYSKYKQIQNDSHHAHIAKSVAPVIYKCNKCKKLTQMHKTSKLTYDTYRSKKHRSINIELIRNIMNNTVFRRITITKR